MDSIELLRIERRSRLSYEWARARRALLGVAPLVLITSVAAWVGGRPALAFPLGAIVFVWGFMLLWYGRDPRRAVLPGIAAGLVPLTFALCATFLDHGCTGSACIRLCVPACALGGAVAGLTVAAVGHARRHGLVYWVSASGIALLTGAMGCTCVGYWGVFGMAFGYVAGLVPAGLRAVLSRIRS